MRLEITRRADLATRALVALHARGERMKAPQLAAELDASAGYLAQALSPLVARGWVRSEPGPTGGYRLVADLADVSVLQVIEAVEGPTDVVGCVLDDRPCGRSRHCALHAPWARARSSLLGELAATPVGSIGPR